MTIAVNIGSAKDRLSQLIAAAMRGEDVVIAHSGKPQVRLVPVADPVDADREVRRQKLRAVHGSFKGRIDMSLDWEAPTMTEEQVREWEEQETARYRGGDAPAA